MRINITYTDYKNNKLYNQVIKYNLNNEIKINETVFNDGAIRNYVNINNTYCVCEKVIEYIDISGNINYRINIQPQFRRKKYKKIDYIDKVINTLCGALYINILTDGIGKNDIMTIMIDESRIIIDESIPIHDVSIVVNIYDNIGIFDMIKLYQINKV